MRSEEARPSSESGALDVLYLVRCETNEIPMLASEGERVVVHATIDVSTDKAQNPEGKEVVVKAMATKIVREK
ncbi:MAG: hypothetical protein HP492_08000 [Nitrospira sp.]|nr:hypothetical protein [Nitrospira sp.]